MKAAKLALEDWVRRTKTGPTIPSRTRSMPTVHPVSEPQKQYQLKLLAEATAKQRYRQDPEDGKVFTAEVRVRQV